MGSPRTKSSTYPFLRSGQPTGRRPTRPGVGSAPPSGGADASSRGPFKLEPGVNDAQIEALEERLGSLPGAVPGIRRFEFGRDLGLSDGNYDLALVADFDDAEGWRAYAADETHRQVTVDRMQPLVDAAVRVQYEV